MAYGHDFKSALKDYTVFAGKIPLPPRYAFGYWWSRYRSYSDNELRELLRKFRMYDIPLDVLVIDMDWHYTEPGKGGWSGWTWNKRLFPNPGRLLADLKKEGVKLTLNLHPADGFAFYEELDRLLITGDVSHLSDKGFWDIANHSTRPFAASHSNCRALSPHNRNLTDEMIRALAEKGGIAGLNYCASFVDADSAHPKLCRSTVERLAKHAAHFKQVGGIEVISLGSDFDGIGGQHELETAADMPLLAEALRREGFTEDEVEAIYWRNAYRFFKNNL